MRGRILLRVQWVSTAMQQREQRTAFGPERVESTLSSDVRNAQAGQKEALRSLVLRFQDLAVGYAFSLLGDYHLAEDAAQEALVAMIRNIGQLREPAAFVGWLRAIVFKHCDRIRRRRRPEDTVLPLDERLVDGHEGPDRAGSVVETGRLVREAVAALPAAQREAVTLYYMSDMSGPEVAAFLGLPLTTIKKRLHDARLALRRRMTKMTRNYMNEHRPSRDAEFSDQVLRLAAPDEDSDAPKIYSLFEAEDHPSRREWRGGRLSDSHADWEASRAAFVRVDGAERLVGAVSVFDLAMRIGSADIRTAGFNGEVLDADFADRKDVLEAAYVDAVGAMRDAGYDLAVTFDDESLWLENGFALGWRALEWRVARSDLPAKPIPGLERIEAVHRDDLAAAFNDSHATLTGSVRRPTYRRNKHPGLFTIHAWKRGNGNGAAGYVSVDSGNDTLWVDEVAGDPDACLSVIRSIADASGCDEVLFDRLHYKSAVGVKLRQMGSCRLGTGTRLGKARWYVVRIVNLVSLLAKLAPVLHDRLMASSLADWRGSLTFVLEDTTGTERVTVEFGDDGATASETPATVADNAIVGGQAIAQLLLGCESPDEVVAVNGIDVRGDATKLLPILFPPQYPQMENQAL